MKWSNHMSALRNDPEVAVYLDECGRDRHAGYGFLMMVFETIAESMEPGSSRCSVQYPYRTWQRLCNAHANTVAKYMGLLPGSGVVRVTFTGSRCEVEALKLLQWRDEYSRKSGHAPDNVAAEQNREEKEKETEEDEEQKAPATSAGVSPAPIQCFKKDAGLVDIDIEQLTQHGHTLEDIESAVDILMSDGREVSYGAVFGICRSLRNRNQRGLK